MAEPTVVVVNPPNSENISEQQSNDETPLLMLSQQLAQLQTTLMQSIELLSQTLSIRITDLSERLAALEEEVETIAEDTEDTEQMEEIENNEEVIEIPIVTPPIVQQENEDEDAQPRKEQENWLNKILFH